MYILDLSDKRAWNQNTQVAMRISSAQILCIYDFRTLEIHIQHKVSTASNFFVFKSLWLPIHSDSFYLLITYIYNVSGMCYIPVLFSCGEDRY